MRYTPKKSAEAAEAADEGRRSEAGDTLVEVLLAIVILAIAGVALLAGFATAISASGQHHSWPLSTHRREPPPTPPSLRSNLRLTPASLGRALRRTLPNWTLPGNFFVSAYTYQYWNGTAWVAGASYTGNGSTWTVASGGSPNTANCTAYDDGPQLWTMTITNGGKYSATTSTVIYDPTVATPSDGANTTPTQLVFLQPTSTNPGTGTVGGSLSPEPIVAIENSANEIVYNDAVLGITVHRSVSGQQARHSLEQLLERRKRRRLLLLRLQPEQHRHLLPPGD